MPQIRKYENDAARVAAWKQRKREAEAQAERERMARVQCRQERAKQARTYAKNLIREYLQNNGPRGLALVDGEMADYLSQIAASIDRLPIYVEQS